MIDLGGFCGHESLGMLVLGPDLWISPLMPQLRTALGVCPYDPFR